MIKITAPVSEAPSATGTEISIARTAEQIHRVNCFAEGVGLLLASQTGIPRAISLRLVWDERRVNRGFRIFMSSPAMLASNEDVDDEVNKSFLYLSTLLFDINIQLLLDFI